jgi:hypothetical protein
MSVYVLAAAGPRIKLVWWVIYFQDNTSGLLVQAWFHKCNFNQLTRRDLSS